MKRNQIKINRMTVRSGPAQKASQETPSIYRENRKYKGRLMFLGTCFTLFFMFITIRLFQTMAFTSPKFLDYHEPEQAEQLTMKSNILDRNGHILATSIETASAYIDPKFILDADQAAEKIHYILPDVPKESLTQNLKSEKRFFWLKRNVTPEEHYRLHKLGLPGLDFKLEQKRLYPFGKTLAHLVGFTDVDGHGLLGAERAFEPVINEGDKPIQLSVDVRLQNIVHQELEDTIAQFDAIGGMAAIMDSDTGEVLSMVSLPDFNPHTPARKGEEDRLFNRITQGDYEHGSTFKIINTAIALESGKVKIEDQFDARAPLKMGRFTIKDFYPKARVMNVPEIYMYSSNIGSVLISQKMGVETQKSYFKKLGYLEQSPIELLENAHPLIPSSWREINGATIAYGYGIAVTPMQHITAVSTVVNGGYKVKPTILKKSDDELAAEDREQVMSTKTSHMMRHIMRLSVDLGTSKAAAVKGYPVGGKTGTALKAGGKSYKQDERVSSFIGAFPIQDPKYVIMVMVDAPKGKKETYGFATGGWVAAPTAKKIIEKIGPILDLTPQTAPQIDDNKVIKVLYQQNMPTKK